MSKIITVGNLRENNKITQSKTVYMPDGLCPTLQAAMGTAGNCMPFIVEIKKMTQIKSIGNISDTNTQSRTVYLTDGLSPTLCSGMDHGNTVPYIIEVNEMCDVVIGSMQKHAFIGNGDYCLSLTEAMGKGGGQIPMIADIKTIGCMDHTIDNTLESANRVYDTEGLSPTLNTCGGGGLQPKIVDVEKIIVDDIYNNRDARAYDEYAPTIRSERNGLKVIEATPTIKIRQSTQQGFIECEVGGMADFSYPTSQERRGRVQGNGQICPTLTTENIPSVVEFGDNEKYSFIYKIKGQYYRIRIRKLTPRECWRLMGFTDEDFEKAERVNSNTQLYKQAGNSIVVNVLEEIFKQMIDTNSET